MSKNDKIYPQPEKGEPWTGITEEELMEKGFKIEDAGGGPSEEDVWYHPIYPFIVLLFNENGNLWEMRFLIPGIQAEVGKEKKESKDVVYNILLRSVQYMYQIDNMFHGFTDRWLGYI